MMDMSDNTQQIRQQWEMELNVTLDDDTWIGVCSGCHNVNSIKSNVEGV